MSVVALGFISKEQIEGLELKSELPSEMLGHWTDFVEKRKSEIF